jgi:hypothetical protein
MTKVAHPRKYRQHPAIPDRSDICFSNSTEYIVHHCDARPRRQCTAEYSVQQQKRMDQPAHPSENGHPAPPSLQTKVPTGIPPSHLTALSQQLARAPHSQHGVACKYCSSEALMTFSGRPCSMACSRMNCHKPDLTTGFPTSSGAPILASTSSLRNSVPSPGEDPSSENSAHCRSRRDRWHQSP